MGNVTSRAEEPAALYLRDQHRLSFSSLAITSGTRKRSTINIVPNAFPATRVSAGRPLGDNAPVEFVLDPEPGPPSALPSFIIKLPNDDELNFTFTFIVRQDPGLVPVPMAVDNVGVPAVADTYINNLTYVYASTPKEVENLVTREFHADPNLHKNSNVELVGDFTTGGSPSISFDWSWKWKPPKNAEDKGGGWRNSCSFVEYDQRAHRLVTLASFSFWVANTSPYLSQPNSPTPQQFLLNAPPKIRVASAQSVESRISAAEPDEPGSPRAAAADAPGGSPPLPPAALAEPVKVDVTCVPRLGDDVAVTDDGPVFRATIKALEQKTGNMRTKMKRMIKKAEHAQVALVEANEAFAAFMESLKEASATNANAVQPAIDHYFDKIAKEILLYERQNAANLQKIIIEPLNKLYTLDIKQAEAKKRDFEEESREYYAYVGKYLGQRQDSVKAKKLAERDHKYQGKRRNFELKRFDYSTFMQDLSGGRKEQEVLSHLTKYAGAQTRAFLAAAKKVDGLLPQLEALANEIQSADKEYQYQRREREEKRRVLEKSNGTSLEPETPQAAMTVSSSHNNLGGQVTPLNGGNAAATASEGELGRADSTGSQLRMVGTSASSSSTVVGDLSRSPGSLGRSTVGSPPQPSKFKGVHDVEERDNAQGSNMEKNGMLRKEGFLWASSRIGGHADPRAALKNSDLHQFWVVLDQGKITEYSKWQGGKTSGKTTAKPLELHMEIDLQNGAVVKNKDPERKLPGFHFEVITFSASLSSKMTRTYQTPEEEDMKDWVAAISNAVESAVKGRGLRDKLAASTADSTSNSLRGLGAMLLGKSSSVGHGHANNTTASTSSSSSGIPARRITVGGGSSAASSHRGPSAGTGTGTGEEHPDKLLQMLHDKDQENLRCADCGSTSKVEWVSINLAVVLCIKCSGAHRHLGTDISKIRSLTLDITSFTPDIVELLMLVGNRVSNEVWEGKPKPWAAKARPQESGPQQQKAGSQKPWPPQKPGPLAVDEDRLDFIKAKYKYREYVKPTTSAVAPNEMLLMAIKTKKEIQHVIHALALGADPNVKDKSNKPAIFLALASTDPASPSPTPAPPVVMGRAGVGQAAEAEKRSPFPVAELLLQNGARIPDHMPDFRLSRSALQYLEFKLSRSSGGGGVGGNGAAGAAALGISHDTTAATAAAVSPTQSQAGFAAAADKLAREREARLQKRASAGGRLARSPISER